MEMTFMNNFNISEGVKADIRKKSLERIQEIKKVRECYKEALPVSDNILLTNLQFIENLLKACGAENHLHLLSISKNMICIGTRIPMTAVLHPYATQSKELNIDNPLFHRTVTEILIRDLKRTTYITWGKDKDYPDLNILGVHFP
jgi:hypothetical protein